jgi:1,4-dihydroxy-2-naphthoate octaprenyltransferase
MPTLKHALRLGRPVFLLLAGLMYVLGAGISRFLGEFATPAAFWLGLGGAVLAQLSMSLLAEVFRSPSDPILPDEDQAARRTLRDAALYLSIGALAAQAVIAFILFRDGRLSAPTILCLGLSLLVSIVYAVPPMRLLDRGFGELLLTVQMAYLLPAIGFLLQTGSFHRLLNAIIVPLTFLVLAALLALDFSTYAEDIKYGRRTFLERVGWEVAAPLHHGLIIAAYLLLGAAPLLGFSIGLLWPAFLTLPFAILQIFWLRNITLGARPIWNLLTANGLAVFGLTAYLLTLTVWLR